MQTNGVPQLDGYWLGVLNVVTEQRNMALNDIAALRVRLAIAETEIENLKQAGAAGKGAEQ